MHLFEVTLSYYDKREKKIHTRAHTHTLSTCWHNQRRGRCPHNSHTLHHTQTVLNVWVSSVKLVTPWHSILSFSLFFLSPCLFLSRCLRGKVRWTARATLCQNPATVPASKQRLMPSWTQAQSGLLSLNIVTQTQTFPIKDRTTDACVNVCRFVEQWLRCDRKLSLRWLMRIKIICVIFGSVALIH